MSPRPASPETRDRLLDAAQALMLEKSYGGTRVVEVCERAGLTKGAFFHYFPTKEALGEAVVERFGERQLAAMRALLAMAGDDPRDRALALVDGIIAVAGTPEMREGCLVGNLTQEMARTHDGFRALADRSFAAFVDLVAAELEAARARHVPTAAWDPRELASYLVAVLQGSLLLMKARSDPSVVARNLSLYREDLARKLGA